MTVESVFGASGRHIATLDTKRLVAWYESAFGVDITRFFQGTPQIRQYECQRTGYRFWTPSGVAGDEAFYTSLSASRQNYYRRSRWEYPLAQARIPRGARLLEIGCGRGYFLSRVEDFCRSSRGLDFNPAAINSKVCSSDILPESIKEHTATGAQYDVVVSFHVFEHVHDPAALLDAILSALLPGGILIISTPNDDFARHVRLEDPLNLPPHHVGGFTPQAFTTIFDIFDLQRVSVTSQPCRFGLPRYSERTEGSRSFRLFKRAVSATGTRLLNALGEPGHTLLAVATKPALP